MEICRKVSEVTAFRNKHKGEVFGFVPTMGALHEGHASLIRAAAEQSDKVVCSIFVNPRQFNNQQDLQAYPRHEKKDLEMLESLNCDMAFVPEESEIYPEEPKTKFDFDGMDSVMEGAFRPGHFQGVATVVNGLFEIVGPQKAFFGQKDFQQLAIIRHISKELNPKVEIVGCPTIREKSGLALSSRNERLNPEQKDIATLLFNSLMAAKDGAFSQNPVQVKNNVTKLFAGHDLIELEYFELVDSKTLEPVENWESAGGVTACVAAHLGEVRLIDNMVLIP